MLSGLYPYSENTYVGNPISIGPGWLILHTPFVAIHLYILASVFFIALNGILIVYLTGHYRGVTLMSFLLASSLLFWERFVTGTDMLTMGAVSASAVSLFFISKLLKRRWIIMCGIILAVLVCSSRIPLVYLSVVFGGIGLVFGKKRGILIGVVILSGALLLLLLFYLWQPESYSILHVITKAYRLLHSWGMLVNAAVSIFCIYLAIVHFYKTRNLSNAYLALAIAWLIPFGVMSIADIIYRNWDWRMWEGSNYFLPAIMALATWGAIRSCGSSQIVLR
jgi:intracellular septation protein A